jgi:hypothetical protein
MAATAGTHAAAPTRPAGLTKRERRWGYAVWAFALAGAAQRPAPPACCRQARRQLSPGFPTGRIFTKLSSPGKRQPKTGSVLGQLGENFCGETLCRPQVHVVPIAPHPDLLACLRPGAGPISGDDLAGMAVAIRQTGSGWSPSAITCRSRGRAPPPICAVSRPSASAS